MIPLRIAYGTKPSRRHLLVAAALLPVFVSIHYVAYWLRYEGRMPPGAWDAFWITVVWAACIKLVVFSSFRVYQGWNRYVTFHDLIALGKASVASSLLLLLADYLFHPGASAPRGVFLMDFGFTIVVVGTLRSVARFYEEHFSCDVLFKGKTPVFIVGANDSGEALLRSIRRNPKLSYRVVGFIAESKKSAQSNIGGVPVIGLLEETCELAQRYSVSQVLITAGDLSGQKVRLLMDECADSGVAVKVLPSYEQMLRGSVSLRPRQVSIEDLLHREPVQLDTAQLHSWLEDRVLLVTGSSGSIGSEICRQLVQFSPRRIIALDRSENGQFFLDRELRNISASTEIEICIADITDADRIDQVFRQFRPDIVFHAAAYKHVPLMEAHPGEAVKNIALATRALADAAEDNSVESFVMISTDKAVNPTSVMGCCKRVAELYVQSLSNSSRCRFVTVRFGNVLDSAGSVVPVFREQIAAGGPVTVTDPKIQRYFMMIPEASQLVIQAGAMGRGGEIFVLDMGDPIRIVDLAQDMIRLSGLRVGADIEIAFSGLRPGEKLFEELHLEGENQIATDHPKIIVADHGHSDSVRIQHAINTLEKLAREAPERVPAFLAMVVPEYRCQPSGSRKALRIAA